MSSQSEHTALINMFIGICTNDVGWPSTLYDLGYRVKRIEGHLPLGYDAQPARPDVVAASNRLNHAVVAECKSGKNIDPEQDERYKMLKSDDIHKCVKTHDAGRLTHTVCYVAPETYHGRLADHTTLPFIVFGTDDMYGSGDFGHQILNEQFLKRTPIKKSRAPRNYYSFSPSDDKPILLKKICAGIISYAMQKGNMSRLPLNSENVEESILETTHSYAKKIDTSHWTLLIRKVREIIDEAITRYELDPELTKGRLTVSARNKTERIFNQMARDYQKQSRIDEPLRSMES